MFNTSILTGHPQILNPHVRHDLEWSWRCREGCPNGDPDNAGAPRQHADGRVFVTAECAKRMLRDWWAEMGLPIYISRRAKEEGLCLKDMSAKYPKAEEAIAHYFDIRMCGAVYLAKGKKGSTNEGENAQITGPFHLGLGVTEGPVEVMNLSVSRLINEDSSDTTFGTRAIVMEAVMHHRGRFSGQVGKKLGVTKEDMEHLWMAILNAPELRRSAMSGERDTVGLTITTYGDPYGMVPGKTAQVL